MNLIQVETLHVQFDHPSGKDTLSGVNFALDQGENLLLLGPSGCGKSTLAFCLNGLYPRELEGEISGNISIQGKSTSDYQPGELNQQVGVVFQDPETQFCMGTVEDEIAFGLENIKIPHSKMEGKVDQALELTDMSAYKKSRISALSGGQKQKLALSCVLALRPKLLILDEPTANLDPVARKDLIKTIQGLQKDIDVTFIVVEHQLDDWVALADRCLILNRQGEVFYDGYLRTAVSSHLHRLREEGIWLPKVAQFMLSQTESLVERDIPLTLQEFSCHAFDWIQGPFVGGNNRTNKHPQRSAVIEARNLSWKKGGRTILRDLSVNLYKGEFTVLVGANGSGKTSLSRILAGIQTPTSGSIHINGKALKDWKEPHLRGQIGYVFQNPEHQFVTEDVFDEVAFSLKIKGVPETQISEEVHRVLRVCGLASHVHEHPYTLSQGQKRRLSVATMIVDDQAMLLLDEPTFGQDAASNEQLMDLLYQRNQRGSGIVMITHDMDLVHQYATRVIVMENGEIAMDGIPEELWKIPPNILKKWHLEKPVPVKLRDICEKEERHVLSSS